MYRRKEIININGKGVKFEVKDLGYNWGDPVRNGVVVELFSSNDERFCRESDGDAGKITLYRDHVATKASAAAAEAYLNALFPGMKQEYYIPSYPYPSEPLLRHLGIGPSKDGKSLYLSEWTRTFEDRRFKETWDLVYRYYTAFNLCSDNKITLYMSNFSGSGKPEKYMIREEVCIKIDDVGLNSDLEDKEFFELLLDLIDKIKKERSKE